MGETTRVTAAAIATQFTSKDGHAIHLEASRQRKRKSNKTAVNQAIELQDLIMRDAALDDLKPITRAAIARAWCELEETKRKLRMKPLPKPIDVQPKHKPKAAGQSFSDH